MMMDFSGMNVWNFVGARKQTRPRLPVQAICC
jgi:hypothetical protein